MATSKWGMGHEVSYPGGKSGAGVYQTLINLMPPHDLYVEPFLGGGAIMRTKRPAAVNVGVELDRSALKQAMALAGSPWMTMRRQRGMSSSHAVYADAAARFEFFIGNGIDFLARQKVPSTAVVYCDPPYLKSTRRDTADLYQHEMTDDQHGELLSIIKKLPCPVIISGYSSPLYARELRGWNATSFQVQTRGRGRPAAEWVWYNYPKPEQLHDYRFLGDNFRQRDHLKRMITRWKAKLEKMPPVKRQCLLAAIAANAGNGDKVLR